MALGDRLRAERRIIGSAVSYMHHGIDVGDGTVVHARPDDFARPFGGGRVVRTSREEFARGSPIEVVTDPVAGFPPEVIVARALRHVGREGYCPVIDNCEHFAGWCATGRRSSGQIDILATRFSGAVARVASAATAQAPGIGLGTLVRTTLRAGLRTLVPVAVAGEVAALAVEWRAHRAGRPVSESRRAGNRAGLATTVAGLTLVGLRAGPAGALAGAVTGVAVWAGGTVVDAAIRGRS
jgi:hypothetical protein